jgi:hypothetical protein
MQFFHRSTILTILQTNLQINRRADYDIVGYGECPACKTESELVQNRTIECATCGEPYLRNKWISVSWSE